MNVGACCKEKKRKGETPDVLVAQQRRTSAAASAATSACKTRRLLPALQQSAHENSDFGIPTPISDFNEKYVAKSCHIAARRALSLSLLFFASSLL